MPYFVFVRDKDAEIHSTICKDKDDLNKLMVNMRKDYEVVAVNKLEDDFRNEFSDFCETNNEIETGDKK